LTGRVSPFATATNASSPARSFSLTAEFFYHGLRGYHGSPSGTSRVQVDSLVAGSDKFFSIRVIREIRARKRRSVVHVTY
jgi:hypothetical protein